MAVPLLLRRGPPHRVLSRDAPENARKVKVSRFDIPSIRPQCSKYLEDLADSAIFLDIDQVAGPVGELCATIPTAVSWTGILR